MAVKDKGKKEIDKKNKMLSELRVEYIDPNKIKPNKYNPNRQSEHEFELLLKSMREDGFTQPIIVQKANKEIVDGEHRWRAGQALGYKEVPVVFVDMTQEQMRISTLRHNRARGSEDIELAANVLKDLQELGAIDWAQDSLMLDDEEINRLIDDIPAPEGLAGDEFEQAWEPDTVSDSSVEHINRGEGTKLDVVTEHKVYGMTNSSVDSVRAREEQIKSAKSAEERSKIRQEKQTQTISLMFTMDEYEIVRKVLGREPAVKVLEMCKKELGM